MENRFTLFNQSHVYDYETLLDYAGYVNYRGKGLHYKECLAEEEKISYLWTTDISYCVGIGLIYESENQIKKIGLYHSVSEHQLGAAESQYLEKSILSFLKNISDLSKIKVILNFNQEYDSNIKDIEAVKKFINCYCNDLYGEVIPDSNFHALMGSPTFYLATDGSYGGFEESAKKALIRIKAIIDDAIVDNCLSNDLQVIKRMIYLADQSSVDTLKKIKNESDILLNQPNSSLMHFETQVLETIIVWDPILDGPSEVFIKSRGLDTEYIASSDSDSDSDSNESEIDVNPINNEKDNTEISSSKYYRK